MDQLGFVRLFICINCEYIQCVSLFTCALMALPSIYVKPLVGVRVRLGTTADEKYISHMASSITQKRTLEDYLSDDDNTSTKNFWPHFLVIQPASQEKLLTSLSPFANAKSTQGLAGTGELGYDGLNGTRKIGPSYAKSVIYI